MALQVSQGVALDVLADGTSTSLQISIDALLPNSQIHGNPVAVEVTNGGFGAGVTTTASLNGT